MPVTRSAISMRILPLDPPDALILETWQRARKKPEAIDLLDLGGIVLEFDAPVIVRNVLVAAPVRVECAEWDEGLRLQDLVNWRVPDTVLDHDYAHLTRDNATVSARLASGESAETCRADLPLSYLMRFTVSLSLRVWTRLVPFFGDVARRASPETRDMWADVRDMLSKGLSRVLAFYFEIDDKSYAELLSAVKPADYMPPLAQDGLPPVVATPNEIVVSLVAPLLTLYQVTCAAGFHVTSDMMSLLTSRSLMVTPVRAEVALSISGTVTVWRGLVEKSGCWLSDRPFWEPVTDLVAPYLEGSVPLIPCYDGVCTFRSDARRREVSPGVLPPCPRFSVLHGVSEELRQNFEPDSLLASQTTYAERNHLPMPFWAQQIEPLRELLCGRG